MAKAAKGPTAGEFRAALDRRLAAAEREGRAHLDVGAGDLHREVGGYPGPGHRLPGCCLVMRGACGPGDEVVEAPPEGVGATLVIRYGLPRRPPRPG